MAFWFDVADLDVDRLLADWRWLCPQQMTLVARNVFGDLFLRNEAGSIFWLDCAIGKLTKVAGSESQFRESANTCEKRQQWFAEQEQCLAADRGLIPSINQCIGFSTPLIFAESSSQNTMYITDVYEHVSFLGDLNRQLADCPEGTRVNLRVKKPES